MLELDTGESVLAEDVTRITSVQTAQDQATAGDDAESDGDDSQSAAQDPKPEQTARPRSDGLFSWLSLDNVLRL